MTTDNEIVLYNYFRSSASYRVRIALNLKGLGYKYESIFLPKGEQASPAFLAINPQGLVPSLAMNGQIFHQSLAMIEYLEEKYPTPALLPATAEGRAKARALAQIIACDIHPLNNLRVLKYLTGPLGHSEAVRDEWIHHWVDEGFKGMEVMLSQDKERGDFCIGDTPGLVDVCLIPQVFNAMRFGVDMSRYPTLKAITDHCAALEAFAAAAPGKQPDAF